MIALIWDIPAQREEDLHAALRFAPKPLLSAPRLRLTVCTMTSPIKYAHALQGPDRRRALSEDEAIALLRDDTLAWVHLDGTHPQARTWIETHLSYLDPHAISALVAEETRPRATVLGDGVLAILRGVNLNEGAEREDMISIRIYADAHRIVSLSRRRLRAVEDVEQALAGGHGPDDPAAFLGMMSERLIARMDEVVADIDDHLEQLEIDVMSATPETADTTERNRQHILDLRQTVIGLRRYAAPQRDALSELEHSGLEWFDALDQRRLEESRDRLTRLIEDLDAMRERLTVLREEISGQLSDRLNRNMYLISIVSVLFLPLGVLTGLFGVNVGGMPGASEPMAFYVFCGALALILLVQVIALRRMRWM